MFKLNIIIKEKAWDLRKKVLAFPLKTEKKTRLDATMAYVIAKSFNRQHLKYRAFHIQTISDFLRTILHLKIMKYVMSQLIPLINGILSSTYTVCDPMLCFTFQNTPITGKSYHCWLGCAFLKKAI